MRGPLLLPDLKFYFWVCVEFTSSSRRVHADCYRVKFIWVSGEALMWAHNPSDVHQTHLFKGQSSLHSQLETAFTSNSSEYNTKPGVIRDYLILMLRVAANSCKDAQHLCVGFPGGKETGLGAQLAHQTCWYPVRLWEIKNFAMRSAGSRYTRLWICHRPWTLCAESVEALTYHPYNEACWSQCRSPVVIL